MGPILRTRRSTRMDRHAATRRLPTLADQAGSVYPGCIRPRGGTRSSPPCWTPASTYATSRSPPTRRPAQGHALRPRPQILDRHPNYILAAYMASGT
jgi:hypothetical protein